MATRSRRRLTFGEEPGDRCERPRVCKLCSECRILMTTPGQWTNEAARNLVTSWQVTLDSLICKPCRDDVSKCLQNPSFTPRWRKRKEKQKTSCCVTNCSKFMQHNCTFTNIEEVFLAANLECKTPVIPVPAPLCIEHYRKVYNVINPTQTNCATCGMSLKHCDSRTCPNPREIESFLTNNAAFEGHIQPTDKVCITCYKSHLVILQKIKLTSTDEDLHKIICDFSKKKASMSGKSAWSAKEVVNEAMIRLTVEIGHQLLNGEVMLLTQVHNRVIAISKDIVDSISESDLKAVVSSRWVLSSLTATFEHHITYFSKVKKYGTLIYRPNTDLKLALVKAKWALSQGRQSTTVPKEPTETKVIMDNLNEQIHSYIKTLLAADSKTPFDYSTIW